MEINRNQCSICSLCASLGKPLSPSDSCKHQWPQHTPRKALRHCGFALPFPQLGSTLPVFWLSTGPEIWENWGQHIQHILNWWQEHQERCSFPYLTLRSFGIWEFHSSMAETSPNNRVLDANLGLDTWQLEGLLCPSLDLPSSAVRRKRYVSWILHPTSQSDHDWPIKMCCHSATPYPSTRTSAQWRTRLKILLLFPVAPVATSVEIINHMQQEIQVLQRKKDNPIGWGLKSMNHRQQLLELQLWRTSAQPQHGSTSNHSCLSRSPASRRWCLPVPGDTSIIYTSNKFY